MTTENRGQTITLVPGEMIKLIPFFGGNKRQLNFFIRQCEYVISNYTGNYEQNRYIMHTIMGKLVDNAAALISEREDIMTWSEFKELLQQHFGDPRSEDCIAMELESLKIRHNETYLDFCNRIQSVRSTLISKVNVLSDANLKRSKITIYNNTSLNVFLYNLPEHMVRIVRLKAPKTLEEALSIVMEEVNFHEQYTLRNKLNRPQPSLQANQPSTAFKFSNNTPAAPQFKYGIPPGQVLNNRPQQNSNFKQPHTFGYRPQLSHQPQPQQFGVRPQFGAHPQRPQFNTRPTNPANFGYKPNLPYNKPIQNQDISMRTAPPLKMNQGFKLNELECNEPYDMCYDYEQTYYDNNDNDYYNYPEPEPVEQHEINIDDSELNNPTNVPGTSEDVQNFCMRITTNRKK